MFGSLILVLINRCKKLQNSLLFRQLKKFKNKKLSFQPRYSNIQAQHPFKEEARYCFGQTDVCQAA